MVLFFHFVVSFVFLRYLFWFLFVFILSKDRNIDICPIMLRFLCLFEWELIFFTLIEWLLGICFTLGRKRCLVRVMLWSVMNITRSDWHTLSQIARNHSNDSTSTMLPLILLFYDVFTIIDQYVLVTPVLFKFFRWNQKFHRFLCFYCFLLHFWLSYVKVWYWYVRNENK